MINTVDGFSLLEAAKEDRLQELFEQIHAPSERHAFQYNLLGEESGSLPIDKLLYNSSSSSFEPVSHTFIEEAIHSVLFEHVHFSGSGYYVFNNHLFLDPLTDTIVRDGTPIASGLYKDCTVLDKCFQIGDRHSLLNSVQCSTVTFNPNKFHILPFGRRSFNFGHWHLNALSSVYLAQKHFPDALVVLPRLNKWQKESLISLGLYNKSNIIEISPLESAKVPNAMFLSTMFIRSGIRNVKPMISMFKKANFSSMPPDNLSDKWPQLPSRIYLSRKSDPGHKLINEHQVEQEFANRGFLILEPQSVSYHELAYLVSHVEILAGQSGSALIRAGICKPGTTFIQLSYEGFTDYIFHKVPALSGFSNSYLYVEGKESIVTVSEVGASKHFYDIDGWTINIDSFKTFLQNIF